MEIYGASKTILWVSNLLTYALENVVITFIAIFVIKITGAFGKKHSCLLIALLIYVYLMSSTTLAFMISTFFYKSRTASLATMLFNLVLYFSSGLIYQAQMSSILIRGLVSFFVSSQLLYIIHII
jgi:ABC-type multidrug transport system permease subunit